MAMDVVPIGRPQEAYSSRRCKQLEPLMTKLVFMTDALESTGNFYANMTIVEASTLAETIISVTVASDWSGELSVTGENSFESSWDVNVSDLVEESL